MYHSDCRKVLVVLAVSVIMKGTDVGVKIGDPMLYNESSESANATVPMDTSSSTSSTSMLNGALSIFLLKLSANYIKRTED